MKSGTARLRLNPWMLCGNTHAKPMETPPWCRVMQRRDLRCVTLLKIYEATQGHTRWPCMAL